MKSLFPAIPRNEDEFEVSNYVRHDIDEGLLLMKSPLQSRQDGFHLQKIKRQECYYGHGEETVLVILIGTAGGMTSLSKFRIVLDLT